MKCPSCGAETMPGERYCGNCGADLSRMACPSCGATVDAGLRFCTHCGKPLHGPATGAAPSTGSAAGPPAQPARANDGGSPVVAPTKEKPKKKRGCLGCGCLGILSLLLLALIFGALAYFQVPRQLGLGQSPAERLLSPIPDREAGNAIKDELAKGGIDTRGMDVYVLPIKGTNNSIVYATLDASQGFQFTKAKSSDPIVDYMTKIVSGKAAKDAGVTRVGLQYKDAQGQSLLTLTAPTSAITGFAQGTVSRAQLLEKLEGDANWPAFFEEALQQ